MHIDELFILIFNIYIYMNIEDTMENKKPKFLDAY